jgi:hypothetical protein
MTDTAGAAEWIDAPKLPQLRGDEPFTAREAQTVLDFWRFAMSDLRTNNTRGCLAEFVVTRSLGLVAERVVAEAPRSHVAWRKQSSLGNCKSQLGADRGTIHDNPGTFRLREPVGIRARLGILPLHKSTSPCGSDAPPERPAKPLSVRAAPAW